MATIKIKGGQSANLPESLEERELAVTLDTGKLYVGTGDVYKRQHIIWTKAVSHWAVKTGLSAAFCSPPPISRNYVGC